MPTGTMPTRIQDSHVVQLVPSLVLGLLLNTLLALPLRALRGLRCYYVAVGAPSGSKRVKARRGKKDDDIDLGGAEALVLAPLSAQQAAQLTYRGSFENLVGLLQQNEPQCRASKGLLIKNLPPLSWLALQFIVGLFALSSTAAAEVAEQLLGWPGSAWPSMLAFGLTVVALTMLAQVGAPCTCRMSCPLASLQCFSIAGTMASHAHQNPNKQCSPAPSRWTSSPAPPRPPTRRWRCFGG